MPTRSCSAASATSRRSSRSPGTVARAASGSTKAGRVRIDYRLDATGRRDAPPRARLDGPAGPGGRGPPRSSPSARRRAGTAARASSRVGRSGRSSLRGRPRGSSTSRPNRGGVFSAHQMGSVRMGADAGEHPCDPRGRVRTRRADRVVPGLYVGDGSLFPTGIGVNPMVTIMALARRVARTVLAEGSTRRLGRGGSSEPDPTGARAPSASSAREPRRAGSRLRARMISATPTTITPPATSWTGATVSSRMSQPRKTAITGFTNAYVAIERQRRVAEHPGVRRERDEAADDRRGRRTPRAIRVDTSAGLKAASSPVDDRRRRRGPRRPDSICSPVATSGSLGSRARCGREERPRGPRDRREEQRRDPGRVERAVDAQRPGRRGGRRRASRSRSRRSRCRGSRSPKKIRPRTATQTGIIAISTPAMPDGIGLLAPGDQAHAAAHEQRADDERSRATRAGVGRRATAPRADDRDGAEHDEPGDREPDGAPSRTAGSSRRRPGSRGTSSPRRRTGSGSPLQIATDGPAAARAVGIVGWSKAAA